MREIKFRAWDKNSKQWLEIKRMSFNSAGYVTGVDTWSGHFYAIADIELIRFIDIEDKNGVEIYEGDITNTRWETPEKQFESTSTVEWDDDGAYFKQVDVANGVTRTMDHSDYIEVIGNIYENPELLSHDS